jgi:ATP-dependent DNA helicase RecQ
VFRQLVAAGLLIVDTEGHGGLHLAPDCREVLRGEKEIHLRREAVKRTTRSKSGGRAVRALPDDPAEASLFQALRAKRLELAREQGVPPYVIFHDATLTELAHARPRSMTEFASIPGVGQAKLQRYADAFLEVIEAHAE